jgi:hypothetical protein
MLEEIHHLIGMPRTTLFNNREELIAAGLLPACYNPPHSGADSLSRRVKYAFDRREIMSMVREADYKVQLAKFWERQNSVKKTRFMAIDDPKSRFGRRYIDLQTREEGDKYHSYWPGMGPVSLEELYEVQSGEYNPRRINLPLCIRSIPWDNVTVYRAVVAWAEADFSRRHKLISDKYINGSPFENVSVEYSAAKAEGSKPETGDKFYIEPKHGVRRPRNGIVLPLPLSNFSRKANVGLAKLAKVAKFPIGSSASRFFYDRPPPKKNNGLLDDAVQGLAKDEAAAVYEHIQDIMCLPVGDDYYVEHRLAPELTDLAARIDRIWRA